MQRENGFVRKCICFMGVFFTTINIISGCGASTQEAQTEEAEKEQVLASVYEERSEVPDMYDSFQVETVEIEGQTMYRLSLADRPDFEFLMDEEQTTGTVISGGKSISFPLKCKLFDNSYSGYADIVYQDYTGDGKEDFVYFAMPYTQQEEKTYAGVTVQENDMTVIDLDRGEIVPLEELEEVQNLPRSIPITVVKCTSSETYYDAAWDDGDTHQQTLNRYLFSWEENTHLGYGDSENSYAPGEQVALELSYIYISEGNGEPCALFQYAFPDSGMISACIRFTIPYHYDAQSGQLKLAVEDGTFLLESVSYLGEAKEKEGQVVEVSDTWQEELASYGAEVSEQEAISAFMANEWDDRTDGQKCLYYVNYPDSEDKSAVYLVTLANRAGYVYVYETGVAHSTETGETEYTWLVKEILYRAQSQSEEGE